jgi:acrylyl-CoA reductase (NADPH)
MLASSCRRGLVHPRQLPRGERGAWGGAPGWDTARTPSQNITVREHQNIKSGDHTQYLQSIGAAAVIDRQELSAPGKPIGKERWAGVIDSVGSHTLANACATTRYRGAVAACGLAQGMDFPASVAPFILRGVTLYGIDSVMVPLAVRQEAWERLARDIDIARLDAISHEIALSEVVALAPQLLEGKVRGRVVVDVNR